MKNNSIDRYNKYWGSMEYFHPFTVNEFYPQKLCPQMTSKEFSEMRDFLINKCNAGRAIRVASADGKSELSFIKVPQDISIATYIQYVFNTLPVGAKLTTASLYNMLAKNFQNKCCIYTFIYNAKKRGNITVKTDASGNAIAEGSGYVYIKQSDVAKTPRRSRKSKIKEVKPPKSFTADQKEVINTKGKADVKRIMSGMTAADAGNAIFHATIDLIAENETLKSQNKSLKEENDTLRGEFDALLELMAMEKKEKEKFTQTFDEISKNVRGK